MPAAPSTGDSIYSGRTETLSNTHKTASNASGNPITSQTPIFGFISYPLCFRHLPSEPAPFTLFASVIARCGVCTRRNWRDKLCQIVAARAICATSCRHFANRAVTTRHDIGVAMRTLAMPMHPDDLLGAPACRALWLHHSAICFGSRTVHLCLAIAPLLIVRHIRSLNP